MKSSIATIIICTFLNICITTYFIHDETRYCRACVEANREIGEINFHRLQDELVNIRVLLIDKNEAKEKLND